MGRKSLGLALRVAALIGANRRGFVGRDHVRGQLDGKLAVAVRKINKTHPRKFEGLHTLATRPSDRRVTVLPHPDDHQIERVWSDIGCKFRGLVGCVDPVALLMKVVV